VRLGQGAHAHHDGSILVNHEADFARGALAFDDAGQAARLKSPRSKANQVTPNRIGFRPFNFYVNQNVLYKEHHWN
jgi:hypothetical protein